MNLKLVSVLRSSLLFVLIILLSSCLSPAGLVVVLVFHGIALTLTMTRSLVRLPWVLGVSTLLCAGVSRYQLTVLGLSTLFYLRHRESDSEEMFHWPFTFVLLSWAVGMTVWGFDLDAYEYLYDAFGAGALSIVNQSYRIAAPSFLAALDVLARYLCLFELFLLFRSDKSFRESFARGLSVSILAAIPLFIAALYLDGLPWFENMNSFWRGTNRFAGTLSDPNAFGIVLVLLFSVFHTRIRDERRGLRVLWVILFAVWCGFGVLSGSRSLLLGAALYCALSIYRIHPRYLLALGIFVGGLVVLAIGGNWSADLVQLQYLPASIQRVLQSGADGVQAGLEGRIFFFHISASIFFQNPLFGVGPGVFRGLVPSYAALLEYGTGLWSDNPNNFYLGILVEFGILGALALAVSISRLRWVVSAQDPNAAFQRSLFCFVILLVLGPHTEFPEVMIVLSYLASVSLVASPAFSAIPGLRLVGIISVICIGVISGYAPQGWYGWESDGSQHWRWTSGDARGYLSCDAGQVEHVITLRSLLPGSESNPLSVEVFSGAGFQQTITLPPGRGLDVAIPCPRGLAPGKVWFSLQPSRIWVPALMGMGRDWRLLGVQVLYRTPAESR